MEERRNSAAAASGYERGAAVASGKYDESASGSPFPTPSPSACPPLLPAVASAIVTAPPGGVGTGFIMAPGMAMAPHHPLASVGQVVCTGMGLGNVGFGEDLARKKRGRPRKYGPEGMHGGAALALSSPPPSIVHFSPVSAGDSSSTSSGATRPRGRPLGSCGRQSLAALGEWFAYTAGGNFTPYVVTVAAGEDVAARILSFSQKGSRAICILSANGSISNVTIRQPGSSGGTLTYEGSFEIISLSGSFTITENGGLCSRTGGISVSLAGPDGRVVGGGVASLLLAASPIQVVVGSFFPNIMKHHKQRPSLQSPPFSAIQPASGVLTAASSLSQAVPDDECKTPTWTLPGHAHGGPQSNMSNNTDPTYSSFQPVSCHVS